MLARAPCSIDDLNNFGIRMVLTSLLGQQFHLFQKFVGMRHLQDGVAYYAEVHTSFWNSCIHTIFMPFTMFGFFIAVPEVLGLSLVKATQLRLAALMFYFSIYVELSLFVSVVFALCYYVPLYFSDPCLSRQLFLGKKRIVAGFSIAFVALLIQEVLGHYIGGDRASRIEAVPNAIIYAPYYSVSHLFSHF